MLNNWAKNRILGKVPINELHDYKEYMKHTLVRKGSTEYALFVCFDHFIYSKVPLDEVGRLSDSLIPISFWYGDRDWMKNTGKHDVLGRNPFKGTFSSEYIVENSDHHLYLDNPDEFAQQILLDLSTLD